MRRFLQLSLLGSTLLFGVDVAVARAQELDENGARLKTLFEEMVATQQDVLLSDSARISFEGNVSVEPVDDYYAVTLPFLSIDYNNGDRFEVGLIAINAAPHNDPDQWKMTFALPTPMNYVDGKSKENTYLVSIGGQRSSGVWNGKLGYFSKLDANYENVMITDQVKGFDVSVPATRIVYDLDADEKGLWSGPVYFTFNDILATARQGGAEIFSLGALNVNMEIFSYDPQALKKYSDAFLARLQQDVKAPESAVDDVANDGDAALVPPAQPSTDIDPADDIAGFIEAALGNGFTSEYQISELKIFDRAGNGPFETLSIGDANFGMDVTGLLSGSVTINLRAGYNGLDFDPPFGGTAALAPANVNLDMAVEKIPYDDVIELGKKIYADATRADTPESVAAGAHVGGALVAQLPALLSRAGTSLVIDNNYAGNDLYHLDLNGKVLSDDKAAYSATADITAKFKGLDELGSYLSGQIAAEPNSPSGAMQQALMAVTVLKGLAKAGVNEDGEPVHVFHVVLNPQGQIFLNGNDATMLSGLMGMGGAPIVVPASPDEHGVIESVPLDPALPEEDGDMELPAEEQPQ